jgi:PIN domain nuclease of toxin-antitoxin system
MRILLDTHVFIWCLEGKHISDKYIKVIEQADEVYISSISCVEINTKVSLGKLKISFAPEQAIKSINATPLSFTTKHSEAMRSSIDLEFHDPFDRMLLAQAYIEKLVLFTVDSKLLDYSLIKTIDPRSNK